MNELVLFAGAGLGTLGTHHLLGWRAVGYVEMAEYPCKVLEARIKDGLLSPAPIFHMHTGDFIRLGYAAKYRGVARVVTAGFPCQPFSAAGLGLADKDPRNGWPDTIGIIRLVRPQYILLENVSRLVSSPYFGVILSDLAQSGYSCRWDCVPASAVGANHERDRLWIVAYSDNTEWGPCGPAGCDMARDDDGLHAGRQEAAGRAGIGSKALAHAQGARDWRLSVRSRKQESETFGLNGNDQAVSDAQSIAKRKQANQTNAKPRGRESRQIIGSRGWWETEPGLGRVDDGSPNRVDRLRAIGNGQVPAVVAEVWRLMAAGGIAIAANGGRGG